MISVLFAVGILNTIGAIGGITAAAGRMMGDVGRWGNYFVAGIFFVVRMHLLGVIPMPWSGPGQVNMKRKGLLAAFVLGLVCGIALGPCAAPVTEPADPKTGRALKRVWLPAGEWFNFFTGQRFTGGQWREIPAALEDIPVFAKAGAIVPLASKAGWGGIDNPAELDVHVFIGAEIPSSFMKMMAKQQRTRTANMPSRVSRYRQTSSSFIPPRAISASHPPAGHIASTSMGPTIHLFPFPLFPSPLIRAARSNFPD